MSRQQKFDPIKNTFPFPNNIFLLGLCPGELAVYSYLICCANRKTLQCWPSYKTISKAVGMTENTVAKYVGSLERKDLIRTEPTYRHHQNRRKAKWQPALYRIPVPRCFGGALSAAVGTAGPGNRPRPTPVRCMTPCFAF